MREHFARLSLLLIVIGLPLGILGYEWGIRPHLSTVRVIDIVASVPESGGFQPASIRVEAGETVTLRFHASDVTHGVAIGPALGIDLGTIEPGHVKEVTLTFDKGGTYTFYCNTWCSPAHWRMRGIIEVVDPGASAPTPQNDPVIAALSAQGINIDDQVMDGMAPTPAPPLIPHPSAIRGAALVEKINISAELRDENWRRTHTPDQALDSLAKLNPALPKPDLNDVVAYFWAPSAASQSTAILYAKNCAACHGETGDGKGPASSQTVKPPASFSDTLRMYARRSDVLYAKIRRGGMGTDMPNFGTVLTPDETWGLVEYLWSFAVESPGQN